MGQWSSTCLVSNLPIREDDEVVAFILKENVSNYGWLEHLHSFNPCQHWSIVGLPIYGVYSGMGWLKPFPERQQGDINCLVLIEYIKRYWFHPITDDWTAWEIIDLWNDYLWGDGAWTEHIYSRKPCQHSVVFCHRWAYDWAYAQNKNPKEEWIKIKSSYDKRHTEFEESISRMIERYPEKTNYTVRTKEEFYDDYWNELDIAEENLYSAHFAGSDGLRKQLTGFGAIMVSNDPKAGEEFIKLGSFLRHLCWIGRFIQPPLELCADYPYQKKWNDAITKKISEEITRRQEEGWYCDEDE